MLRIVCVKETKFVVSKAKKPLTCDECARKAVGGCTRILLLCSD